MVSPRCGGGPGPTPGACRGRRPSSLRHHVARTHVEHCCLPPETPWANRVWLLQHSHPPSALPSPTGWKGDEGARGSAPSRRCAAAATATPPCAANANRAWVRSWVRLWGGESDSGAGGRPPPSGTTGTLRPRRAAGWVTDTRSPRAGTAARRGRDRDRGAARWERGPRPVPVKIGISAGSLVSEFCSTLTRIRV